MTRSQQLISVVQQSQFSYLDSLIHLFVGGSELHGAKLKAIGPIEIGAVPVGKEYLRLQFFLGDTYESNPKIGCCSTAASRCRDGRRDSIHARLGDLGASPARGSDAFRAHHPATRGHQRAANGPAISSIGRDSLGAGIRAGGPAARGSLR